MTAVVVKTETKKTNFVNNVNNTSNKNGETPMK